MTILFNEFFKTNVESYYWAAIITGAIKGTSHDHLYQELGLESLLDRRWSCAIFLAQKCKWSIASMPSIILKSL